MNRELLRLTGLPIYQNKVFASADEALACPTGDVLLCQDGRTGLVANIAFEASRLDYDGSYQNEQGHSPAFRIHLEEVAALVRTHFDTGSILEVGCGKGVFLDRLRSGGLDARGIDPAYEGHSPHIIAKSFSPELGVRGDGIVLRHTLEHLGNPYEFLAMLREANGGGGKIYIEVPCLEWILHRRAWFDFFYEHVNYFRAEDFRRLFGRRLALGHLFGGQYLYVIADLASLRDPSDPSLGPPDAVAFPCDLMQGLTRCAERIDPSRPQLVWGAAAKGATYALHLQRSGVAFAAAVDINPAKQGHYLPTTGLPILEPSEALARLGSGMDIHVMNSNYLDEIRRVAGAGHRYLVADAPLPNG